MSRLLTVAAILALLVVGRADALSIGHSTTIIKVHGVKGHQLPIKVMDLIPEILTADADAIFDGCGLSKGDLDQLSQILKAAPEGALKGGGYALDSTCKTEHSQIPNDSLELYAHWNTMTSNQVNIDCDILDVCVTTVLQGSPIFPIPAVAVSKAEGLLKPGNPKLAKASTLQALEDVAAFGSLCPATPVLSSLGLSADNLDGNIVCAASYEDRKIALTLSDSAASVLISGELVGAWDSYLYLHFRPDALTDAEVKTAINHGFERWRAQAGQPDLSPFGKWDGNGGSYYLTYTLHFSIAVFDYGDQKHVRGVFVNYSPDISIRPID